MACLGKCLLHNAITRIDVYGTKISSEPVLTDLNAAVCCKYYAVVILKFWQHQTEMN